MVLTELLNDFSARGTGLRQAATSFVDQLRRMSTTARATIVPQTPGQFEAAHAIFRERGDKSWSLTDCASFLCMMEREIGEVLTYDQHFMQMGLKALLR